MSNNTVVSVHETCKETYHARFCIIYNRTCNHGCLENSLSDYIEASIMLRFNHKQQDL